MCRYENLIARIAFHYMKNWSDTEDVVQEVILKLIQTKPRFDSQEHEKAWIIRVTMNLCIDKVRSFWHKNVTCSGEQTFHGTESTEEKDLIEVVLTLPEKQRMVVYLHYYEGYKLKDIAELMKRSPNTIQTWHERAKKALRRKLGVKMNDTDTDKLDGIS